LICVELLQVDDAGLERAGHAVRAVAVLGDVEATHRRRVATP
jgi:hypothetical protein